MDSIDLTWIKNLNLADLSYFREDTYRLYHIAADEESRLLFKSILEELEKQIVRRIKNV
jgi:hypothetical protein